MAVDDLRRFIINKYNGITWNNLEHLTLSSRRYQMHTNVDSIKGRGHVLYQLINPKRLLINHWFIAWLANPNNHHCFIILRSGIRFNKSHSNVKWCVNQMANLKSILCTRLSLKIFLYEQHLIINYDIYNVHNRILNNVNFRNYLSPRTNDTLFDIWCVSWNFSRHKSLSHINLLMMISIA